MPNLINSDPLRQICLALARLGTADPGERSAAARQARDLARAAGLTLDQALDRLAQPQPAPARRPEPADGMDAYVPQERLGHILAEFQLSRVKRQVAPPPPAAPPRRAAAPAAPSTIRLGGRDWPIAEVDRLSMRRLQEICTSEDDLRRVALLRGYKSGWIFHSWSNHPSNPVRTRGPRQW